MIKRCSPAALRVAALIVLVVSAVSPSYGQLRKIGELDLYLRGVSAALETQAPVVPKNTAAGVRVVVRSGEMALGLDEITRFVGGPFRIEADYAGPGLRVPVSLPYAGAENVTNDPLILALPPVTVAGDYELSNIRITVAGRTVLDVLPRRTTVQVIDQVLITSVTTKPLTLDELKDRGIVLDNDSYLGFEFTLGVKLESKAVDISFPVVFDSRGVVVPQPLDPPPTPTRAEVPLPTIVPMLLKPVDGAPAPTFRDSSGKQVEIRIPSVLVIPGNVGYLKQHFSAQLLVANGAPAGSGLTVRDVTGKINLPPGADLVRGTADDPLMLPDTVDGPQGQTLPVRALGPDGQPGTPDDGNAFAPGQQGQTEFVIRGEKEGFHNLDFDIDATLDGLVTGPVKVSGKAAGGVLVRNPFFDLSFSVPAVARQGELFKVYVTVNNISQSLANDVRLTLDGARMSGARLVSSATQSVPTLPARDSAVLEYTFRADRTGQVVASYLHFDTTNGSTGDLKFTLAVGERGVPLSPDTLVLPAAVDNLPRGVVDAAMRVLGQGWSIANAPAGTLPSSVTRTSKAVVTQKALALAEAGLRVGLGQPVLDAVRDLLFDFAGGSPYEAGFDQLMRQTEAGREFGRSVGAALQPAMQAAGGVVAYERKVAEIATSGSDFATIAIGNGSTSAPVTLTVKDRAGKSTADILSAISAPLGTGSGAPLFLAIPNPLTAPFTLELAAVGNGTVDLAVTLPYNGASKRAYITGFAVQNGTSYRIVADPQRSITIETDTNGDGLADASAPLTNETLYPQGPRFTSATVIGPETLAGASPFGFQVALLFDRAVDATSAADVRRYSMPANTIVSAKRQLSGRLVFASMQQPEGPYVPSSVTAGSLNDMRGASGPGGTVTLQSRLADIGAVVSGRIVNADGTPVAGAPVTYAQNPILDCAPPLDDYAGLTNAVTGADGRYELRYVRQDACGMPFQILTTDRNTGALRQVSSSVRVAGEQIVLDIALFGRGSVSGVVKDLTGKTVAGASVVAISETDPQVSGAGTTDLSGRYRIDGITVGGVRLTAAKGASVGRGFARIDRAGTVAAADLTLDGGSVAVSGFVRKLEGGVVTTVPALQVVYFAKDGGAFYPVAVTTTSSTGAFSFAGMPTGEYRIEAALNTRDRGAATGVAAAGDRLTMDVLIDVRTTSDGTVRGTVKLPDGSAAAGAIVTIDNRGVLSGPDGRFELPGVAPQGGPRTIVAQTRDALRRGTNTIYLQNAGEVVDNITVVLSGLATGEVTVRDANGNLLQGQDVVLLTGCDEECGCAKVTTDSQGRARFENLPLGSITARATRNGVGFVDQVTTTLSLTKDGATVFGIMTFPGSGTVTGSVLDPEGRPALGADVTIVSKTFDDETCTLVGGVSHRVRTGQDGRFRVTGVNVGAVSVTVTHPFYPSAAGDRGTLAANGSTLNFDFRLTNTIAGELAGVVFLPDGTTPAGTGVEVTANGVLPDVTVVTDANGAYRFAKIFPAGYYSLTARDSVTGGVVREDLYLQAGQDVARNLRLKGRGTVSVNVVDGAGVAVSNAFVKLTETDFPNRVYEGAIQPSNEGVVTFENVFEGRLVAEAADAFARGGRTASVLARPGDVLTIKVALTVTGKVKGRFLRADGATAIAFGAVRLVANGRVIGTTTTGTDGAFSFDYVPAGQVRVEATDPLTARSGFAAGAISSEGQEITLDVVAQSVGTVRGLVTSNGAAQPGAHVTLTSGAFQVSTVADSDGRYEVQGVPAGLVAVTASLDGSFLSGTSSAPLAGEGTAITIDVALRASGKVAGRVLRSDSTPATLAVVTVQVGGTGGGTLTTTTAEDSSFAFDRVPAGLATFSAEVPGSVDRGRTTTEVVGVGTTDVTITLNGSGSVNGRALDSAGQPIGGDLTLQGTGAFPYTIPLRLGTDGKFTLKDVLAGPYTATLKSQAGEFTLYGTAAGTIAANVVNDVTVQLQPSGSVTGTVLRSDGTTPAYGATVTIHLEPNRGDVTIQTGANGTFTATGVPLGGFSVTVADPLSGGLAAISNLTLQTNGEVVAAGTIVIDDTPVAVLSVDPADGATGVATNAVITLVFTDALQSAAGVSVLNGTSNVSLNAVLSADRKTVTLSGTLPDAAELTVQASNSLTDIFGRHPLQTFTSRFRTVDKSAPKVKSIVPADGAIQVTANSNVTVTFDEPLGAQTNVATLIAVKANNVVVNGTVASTGPGIYTFTPAAPLAADAAYVVTVAGAVDLSGNAQTTTFVSTFATTDTVAPLLTRTSPAQSWTNDATPTIQFSLGDALSGIDAASITMTIDGATVKPTFSGTAITYTPAASLVDGTHAIAASAADRAGNRTDASFSFLIDTTAPVTPTLSGISEGQVLKGTITLTANATDDGSGLASIEVLRDNGIVLARLTGPSFSLAFDTNALAEGLHTFSARAIDVAGNISATSAIVNATADNRVLGVTINAPAAQQRVRDSVSTNATVTEPVQRVDFAIGTLTVSDATAPYDATFTLAPLAEGTQTITVTAYGLLGDTATATRPIVIDRTPPAAPDASKIAAEPPTDGRSLVFAHAGAVEASATVEVKNTRTNAILTLPATIDGSFSVYVDAQVDDVLSLTATDFVGNRGASTNITVRRLPSLPPANGATTLHYDGILVDRVGTTSNALTGDGKADAVFTVSLNVGEGVTRTLSYIDLVAAGVGSRTTHGGAVLGVAANAGGALLNNPDGSVNFPVIGGTTLSLFAADEGFIRGEVTYTVAVYFTDGSRFIATTVVQEHADDDSVPHSGVMSADKTSVRAAAGAPGTAIITITDIRDIHGSLVEDGTKIALSAANGATKSGFDNGGLPSAGGSIVDGTPAANNPNFRVFTVTGGRVTATYSSADVLPPALTGAVAVVQMLAADAADNIVGTQAIASLDLNLKLSSDRAILHAYPPTLYGDKADRRSQLRLEVRDANGNVMPDGSKFVVSAASCASRYSNGYCVDSNGGAILGGTNNRVFTVTNGVATAEFSAAGLLVPTGGVRTSVIQVLPADANGNPTTDRAIGLYYLQVVGAANVEMEVSPDTLPGVDPISTPASVRIHHLHDQRGNLTPANAKVLLNAASCASRYTNGYCVDSYGGTIVDGTQSPNGGNYRYYTLTDGYAQATYSPTVGQLATGQEVTATIQALMADMNGFLASDRVIGLATVRLVGPYNARGSATPTVLFGDGALQTSTVTFDHILDTNGNPLPEGSAVVATVADCGARYWNGYCVGSAGGQILNGAASPSGASYKLYRITNGSVVITYGNQGIAVPPSQSRTPIVSLLPANAAGAITSDRILGTVSLTVIGLTTGQGSVSPATIHADGADFRSTVTFSDFKDAQGRPVPDGTKVVLTVSDCAARYPNGYCVGSAGGAILGGEAATFGAAYRVFTITNGQVVGTYSSLGVVSTNERFATVSVMSIAQNGALLSDRAMGTVSIRLVAPQTATVSVSPAELSGTGVSQTSQITVSDLKDVDPAISVPDGSKIAIAVGDCNSRYPNGYCVGSAGGTISAAGTMPGDGTPISGTGFKLFTVSGGQIKATYTSDLLWANIGQTITAVVQIIPANSSGQMLTDRVIGTATIKLHGTTSTVAPNTITIPRVNGTTTVTFTGIKDAAGNTVPDGTLVAAAAGNCYSRYPNGYCVDSIGGTITSGVVARNSTAWRIFSTHDGSVSIDYSSAGATAGTDVHIQLLPATPAGDIIGDRTLFGGVATIKLN